MSWNDDPPEWEVKLHEFREICDRLAVAKAKMNYLERMERRMFSLVFKAATGNIEERKAAFYGSDEYQEMCKERRESEYDVYQMTGMRDALSAWFSLHMTDRSYEKEQMRLAR